MNAGPFLWGKRVDGLVFGGSAALATALVVVGHVTGISDAPMPAWSWLLLVVAVDVGHVWTTIGRTYLDSAEFSRRRVLYTAVPVAAWLTGALLYRASPIFFWRVLAYLALLHFVRQQIGWVAIYRARARDSGVLGRVVDQAVVYAATLYPVAVWHARMPRHFDWFVAGDFVAAPAIERWLAPLGWVYALSLGAFAGRQISRARATGTWELGKWLVVVTTAFTWWLGIAATNSDFDFTACNVVVHGAPYAYLLWRYAKANARRVPHVLASKFVHAGAALCVATIFVLAFVEEALWDRLVWHDNEWLFGGSAADRVDLEPLLASLVVPLLALPQATHYVLDAVLWRNQDKNAAQSEALGFTESARSPIPERQPESIQPARAR